MNIPCSGIILVLLINSLSLAGAEQNVTTVSHTRPNAPVVSLANNTQHSEHVVYYTDSGRKNMQLVNAAAEKSALVNLVNNIQQTWDQSEKARETLIKLITESDRIADELRKDREQSILPAHVDEKVELSDTFVTQPPLKSKVKGHVNPHKGNGSRFRPSKQHPHKAKSSNNESNNAKKITTNNNNKAPEHKANKDHDTVLNKKQPGWREAASRGKPGHTELEHRHFTGLLDPDEVTADDNIDTDDDVIFKEPEGDDEEEEPAMGRKGMRMKGSKSGSYTMVDNILYAMELEATSTTITIGFSNVDRDMAMGHQLCVVRVRSSTPLETEPSNFVESQYEIYDKDTIRIFDIPVVMAEFRRSRLPSRITVGNNANYGGFVNGPLASSSFYQMFVREIHRKSAEQNVEHFKVTNYLRHENDTVTAAVYNTMATPPVHILVAIVRIMWANKILFWGLIGAVLVGLLVVVLLLVKRARHNAKYKKLKRKSRKYGNPARTLGSSQSVPLLLYSDDDTSTATSEDHEAFTANFSKTISAEDGHDVGIVAEMYHPQLGPSESLKQGSPTTHKFTLPRTRSIKSIKSMEGSKRSAKSYNTEPMSTARLKAVNKETESPAEALQNEFQLLSQELKEKLNMLAGGQTPVSTAPDINNPKENIIAEATRGSPRAKQEELLGKMPNPPSEVMRPIPDPLDDTSRLRAKTSPTPQRRSPQCKANTSPSPQREAKAAVQTIAEELETLKICEKMLTELNETTISDEEFRKKYNVSKEEVREIELSQTPEADLAELNKVRRLLRELEAQVDEDSGPSSSSMTSSSDTRTSHTDSADRCSSVSLSSSCTSISSSLTSVTSLTKRISKMNMMSNVKRATALRNAGIQTSNQKIYVDAFQQYSSQESLQKTRLPTDENVDKELDIKALRRYLSSHARHEDSICREIDVHTPPKVKSFKRLRSKMSEVFREVGSCPKGKPVMKKINPATGDLESCQSSSDTRSSAYSKARDEISILLSSNSPSCEQCGTPVIVKHLDAKSLESIPDPEDTVEDSPNVVVAERPVKSSSSLSKKDSKLYKSSLSSIDEHKVPDVAVAKASSPTKNRFSMRLRKKFNNTKSLPHSKSADSPQKDAEDTTMVNTTTSDVILDVKTKTVDEIVTETEDRIASAESPTPEIRGILAKTPEVSPKQPSKSKDKIDQPKSRLISSQTKKMLICPCCKTYKTISEADELGGTDWDEAPAGDPGPLKVRNSSSSVLYYSNWEKDLPKH